MAKFMESTSSIKKSVSNSSGKKKKKKDLTTQERINQKSYGTTKPKVKTVTNRTANTVTKKNTSAGGGNSTQQRYNNKPSGTATTQTRRTPTYSRNPRMQDTASGNNNADIRQRMNASRQRREQAQADSARRQKESEERRNKVATSMNPRIQDTARGTKIESENERRKRLEEARRQKNGDNSMASKSAQKAANRAVKNTPGVVKESAKQVGIGHGKTLADVTAANKSAAIGSKLDIKSKDFMEDIEKRRKKSTEASRTAFKELSKAQEKSEAKMQKMTKDAKGLEKAYYGALESGTGMATDQLLGPAWAASMLSRTYGNTRGKAIKEGATENEDRAYSLWQGAKEVATEYLFRGIGLSSKLSGAKSLAPSEKLANALTRNMRGPAADITHAGVRLLGGTAEENAEEAIGWGLDPIISELTYKKNVRTRQAQQMLRDQSDQLRSNIRNDQDARAMASYLSSDDFIESQIKTFRDNGVGEEESRELAESMRDYLDASLSGDTERMADIEETMSKRLAGKSIKDVLKDELSLSELMDTFASTTLLTMATGLPGSVSTSARGAAVREQLGTDGIRALADMAIDFEDDDMSLKAEAMRDRMDSGKDITSTQAYDLMQGVQEQYAKDSDRQQASLDTAQKTIRDNKMVAPYEVERDGSISMDEVTAKNYQSTQREASDAIRTFVDNSEGQESLTDTQIDRGSRAIAGFQTGVFTVDDANELNYRNTAVRSAFEAETGIDLSEYVVTKNGNVDIPATNTATKNALFAMAADNLVKSAEAETANWIDNTKGEVVTQISRRMGGQGTLALQQALDDVDERDRSNYMMTANATDMLYQAARNMGTEWETAKTYATRMFPNIPETKLKAMYDAGLADRDMATDTARGQQIELGEKIELKNNDAPMGQVLVETKAPVKGTVIRTFSELASNLGVDIHLVDNLETGAGNQANGQYIKGNIYINVNSDFESNMGYIFMHEVTHHLRVFAPEQYQALENLVRDKWFNYDASQMQSEIAKKIDLYARNNQTLTEDEALEEIIADAAHEFINDPNFAKQVADTDETLAKAILNSIRNALRMLRRVLSLGSIEDETHMNTLFSQLDILDEAERIWLEAYTQAVKNRAAVEVDRLQNQIYEEGRQSVSETSDADYMDAVNRGDTKSAQKMVDKAAKNAGFTVKGYHGTTNNFNTFKAGDIGFHFGKNKSTARTRVGRGKNAKIIPAWLSLDNPIKVDVDFGSWDADYRLAEYLRDEGIITPEEYQDALTVDNGTRRVKRSTKGANDALRNILKGKGYDGIEYENYYEAEGATSYIVFDAAQIKNADPVTYDDNGDVIPLSERFNQSSLDIRYSVSEDEGKSNKDYKHAMSDDYELLEAYEEMMLDEDLNASFADLSDEAYYSEYFGKMLEMYGKADKKARKTGKAANVKYDNTADMLDAFYSALNEEVTMTYDDEILEEGRKTMAKSKRDFFSSVSQKWNERWISGGEVLDVDSVKTDIKNLVTGIMANSDADKQYKIDLVKRTQIDMRNAYQFLKQGREDIASALLYHSALRMIQNVEFVRDDTEYQLYQGIRDYLRGEPISMSEDYWQDEKFLEFRKAHFGTLKLRKGKTNVDTVYGQLADLFPGVFSEAERERLDFKDDKSGMLQHIGYVTELNLEPFMAAYSSEECADWAFEIADDLYEIMVNGSAVESIADEYKARNEKALEKERARTEKAVRTAKAYKEKYDAQAKAMKTRHAEAILRIRKARDEGIKAEKQKFKEYKEEQKENRLHSKYFDSIAATHKTLRERLLTNTKDKHIPEVYKAQLAELLASFDLQTVASKKVEARRGRPGQKTIKMSALRTTLKNMAAKSELFYLNDTITDIMDELLGIKQGDAYSRSIDGLTLDELNASELKKIDRMLKALLHEFNNYESVRVGTKRQQAADIGAAQIDACLEHAEKYGNGKDYQTPFLAGINRVLNLDEVTPAYMFRQIDPKNQGIGLMFKELRRSFGKYVRNQNQINDWMEEILGEYQNHGKFANKYGADQIEQWRRVNNAKEFKLDSGQHIKLTPAQMMSILCLSNRQQAYDHMTGAGIVIRPVSFEAKLRSDIKDKGNYATPYMLTDTDIAMIKSQLTPDQVKVATKLQQLMATRMAEWGNEASMSVMGIKLFEDPDYFPIKSDKAALEKDFSADQFAEAIRNFGFTKAVQPGASNAIMVDDIFEVVAEHCNQMNLYNAYSESMNDFMRVYNYHKREDTETGYSDYSVEQAIAKAYSQKATTFIGTFIKDLNGNVSKDRTTGIDTLLNDSLSKAKKASVFANGRVALQQPTALMRAFYVIDPKYLKGFTMSKETMREMFEHSPIALWKSWGYYDINMGKSIEDLMMNNGSWLDDMMSDLYGKLDNRTWAAIWGMCKAEIEDLHPDIEKGSDEYWEMVSERMDEVVDLTQVVDSPFHRSHAMRSKDFFTKLATSFMAEPTLTFNMVRDGLIRAHESWKDGNKAEAGKIAVKTFTVFGLAGATTAAAAAIWDAVRGKDPGDDDEDKNFFELWYANFLENLKDNLFILNNIYYVKDVVSMFQGWDQRNLGLQGWKHLADALGQLTGRKVSSKLTWYENFFAGVGYLSGIPTKTIMNDTKAVFDMFGLKLPESVQSYKDQLDSIGGSAKSAKDVNSGDSPASSAEKSQDTSEGEKKKSAAVETHLWTYEDAPFHVEDGSLVDSFLNHFGVNLTAAEIAAAEQAKEEEEREAKIEDIRKKAEGLSGESKDKKIWSAVTTYGKKQNGEVPLSDMIQEGKYEYVNELRDMYIKAGGNAEYFDERIYATSKTALKKTIHADATDSEIETQQRIKDYLLGHGMDEATLSDICYKSYTAKDLKAAIMLNDSDAAVTELRALIQAGLTKEDFYRLWDNRNKGRAQFIRSYREKGKYKDRFKSTGVYNWPIRGQITSNFGHRSSPGGIGSTNHQGMDIAGSMGDPVGASDGGTVVYAGWYGGAGKTVMIEHDDGTITQYSHLSWWGVKKGDIVGQGQTIGNVGSTGNSTGPHLHFGVKVNGEYVDPSSYLNRNAS